MRGLTVYSDDVPVYMPSDDVPVYMPSDDVPVYMPSDDDVQCANAQQIVLTNNNVLNLNAPKMRKI